MKASKRWIVLVGACALAYLLLLVLARVFDVHPLVWVAQHMDRAAEERRAAEREAAHRRFVERRAREAEEATRGVPYVLTWPFREGARVSRKIWGFQIAVQGDQVWLYQPPPGYIPPPDVWLIYLTMAYYDPIASDAPVNRSWRLRIDEQNIEPFRIKRGEHPHEDELVLTSVTYPNGEHPGFNCLGANALKAFRDATTTEQLVQIGDPWSCRTFLAIRNGIRLMVEFPISQADVAHAGVTRAIALMDRSIVGQEVEAH